MPAPPAVGQYPGAWPGYAHDVTDPTNSGRIRAIIPGVFDDPPGTPYWCWPAGWANSPTPQRGRAFPVRVGTPVILFFLMADPELGAFWLPGAAGTINGVTAAPTPYLLASSEEAPYTAVLHEDDTFLIYVTDTMPVSGAAGTRELVLQEKETGATIRIMASDGASGKAVNIAIEAETQLQLYSKGSIHIDAPRVLINGRLQTGGSKVQT